MTIPATADEGVIADYEEAFEKLQALAKKFRQADDFFGLSDARIRYSAKQCGQDLEAILKEYM